MNKDISSINEILFDNLQWSAYDVIFLGCGFESRSIHIFEKIPHSAHGKCVVLGFHPKTNVLSRRHNEAYYFGKNIKPNVCNGIEDYESLIKDHLEKASAQAKGRTLRIFIDYSVMTRVWYAYILTWIRYTDSAKGADVDFAYTHGVYDGDFSSFQIRETQALAGFEGSSAGTRRTVALYGLGYDKYATLAIHELIQPDSFYCYMTVDDNINNGPSQAVAQQNSEIIEQSGNSPLILPLSDLSEIVDKLTTLVDSVPSADEVMAVAMGPKTHVLGTLLVGHLRERLACIHTVGERKTPVQVTAGGAISCWQIQYR